MRVVSSTSKIWKWHWSLQCWISLGEPDVVSLQVSGTVDTDVSKMTASKLMAWELSNLWREGTEDGYMIHYSQQPMNDFGCTQKGVSVDENYSNFFKKAFPCLFPYEEGGIVHNQPTKSISITMSNGFCYTMIVDFGVRKHFLSSFSIIQHCQDLFSA